ncbi:hypothetical protein DNTS_024327 [Danionella cerebrum]|uniref:Neuromedin Bb n=1 Tax=Danionella cerebrum TaxID=2873325 RepID=A0A553NLL7_9TELE|nr:hypothetical protein DNTS_024327 [Danionella translucida]
MPRLTVASFCNCGFLALLMFSFHFSKSSSVSLDMTELRNKVSKIKVNPRGNLWATGHFMGKKSVVDDAHSGSEQDSTMEAVEAALKAGQQLQRLEPADLNREMRKIALQTRPKASETAILLKILENYFQESK